MTIKKPFEILFIQSKCCLLISERVLKTCDFKMIPFHLNFKCLRLLFITAIFPENIAYSQMIRTSRKSNQNKE